MKNHKKTLSILAIDDDPADLKLLRICISGITGWNDFEFHGFDSWESAGAELASLRVDLIFVDYLLGRETGLEVVKAIRESGDLRPVIVLTGQGDATIAAKITRAGADDYLIKNDLTSETLGRAVSNALAQYKLRNEKELLAAQLAQSQKMETIGSLTGGIAHDFNNMLTAVIGGIELAGDYSTEPQVRKELAHAKNVCDQMAGLVRQLLDFSRRENTEIRTLGICSTLRQLTGILRHTLPKNIRIMVDTQDAHATVKADSSLLQQVLLNLCINGSEAMEAGGVLFLTSRAHRQGPPPPASRQPILPEGDYIVIEIKDTGSGIDKKIMPRIFEPFFTTKQLGSKKGTGLGLSIVWQNIRSMGGTVTVQSSPGEGAVFNVMLPAGPARVERREPSPSDDRATSRKSETILIVDDEQMVARMAAKMLERLGYSVLVALSGRAAVEIFSKDKDDVDLAILDLSMPEMDGMECFRQLTRVKPSLKVYFASGHDMKSQTRDMLDLGAVGVLQKPYTFDELADGVRLALDSSSSRGRDGEDIGSGAA